MPFGAKNSGNTYARFVELCIMKLRSPHILVYIDDVVIHTSSPEDHFVELEKVLSVHKEAGIKLKASKTKIFQKQVEYLGHIISEEGLGMKPSFLDKVINWPTPTTRKALATFLGFYGISSKLHKRVRSAN